MRKLMKKNIQNTQDGGWRLKTASRQRALDFTGRIHRRLQHVRRHTTHISEYDKRRPQETGRSHGLYPDATDKIHQITCMERSFSEEDKKFQHYKEWLLCG